MAKNRRQKRQVFSDRQRDAIKRIATGIPETKTQEQYATTATYISATGGTPATGAFGWVFQNNFISNLRSVSNSGGTSENNFVGKEIQLVGLRFEITAAIWQVVGAPNPGALYDYWFRFTVYETNGYLYGNSIPDPVVQQSSLNPDPTQFKWNVDAVNIKFQKTFKLDCNGNLNAMTSRKFWVPLRRKIHKEEDLVGSASEEMTQIKGMQMYWCLEILSPGNSQPIITDLVGDVSHIVYYKDP